ncbi:MAG: magnesium and cobalt transport protein CorA, partial [Melioribacteraceae bacterium]|nr:magnesium and cobalt transport protein CorA [Melioribacteraceae bacterium]
DALDHMEEVNMDIEQMIISGGNLLDLFVSSQGNKMNEVMKVLTVIATIFIPLTFIAGIYGMNFSNMPELNWEYGYFAALIFMALVGIGFGIYFKIKKWF